MTVMEESGRWQRDGRVAGKVAIVTGGGQVDGPGIGTGKATAILLARHGASVVLVDREPARAEITRSRDHRGRRARDRRRGRRDERRRLRAHDAGRARRVRPSRRAHQQRGRVASGQRRRHRGADVGRPAHGQPQVGVPRVASGHPGDGRHRRRVDREHLVDRRAAFHRVRRVLGCEGRDDLAQPGDGGAARPRGHPRQRGRARRASRRRARGVRRNSSAPTSTR